MPGEGHFLGEEVVIGGEAIRRGIIKVGGMEWPLAFEVDFLVAVGCHEYYVGCGVGFLTLIDAALAHALGEPFRYAWVFYGSFSHTSSHIRYYTHLVEGVYALFAEFEGYGWCVCLAFWNECFVA